MDCRYPNDVCRLRSFWSDLFRFRSAWTAGPWVDRRQGLERVQVDIVTMRTPDGHGRLELTKFRHPKLVEIEPATVRWPPERSWLQSNASTTWSLACAPTAPNSSARWLRTRTNTDSATCEALRASSSRWPRNSSKRASYGEMSRRSGAVAEEDNHSDISPSSESYTSPTIKSRELWRGLRRLNYS